MHIHTSASKKDGSIVKNNTVENIEHILIPKLLENEVDMVALTDHNTFSVDHYNKLKTFEKEGKIKKVLPGVEFDVKKHKHRFHVVVIFDDNDDNRIKQIQIVINKFSKCFINDAYDFLSFVKLLDEFKMPCLTIVHQKSDPKGGNHNQDLSGVGYENFKKELYIDYFDSLEFASLDTEGFLKLRKVEDNLDNLRYITGTDCHDWNFYPNTTKDNFAFTYIKSLPTFMGLVMALTEFNRINLDGGKTNTPSLKSITYNYKNVSKSIELSSGINVIIGDNSIGKSAIIESIFSETPASYHIDYLSNNGLCFTSQKNISEKYLYNKQGEIRKKFEKSGAKLEDDKIIKSLFIETNTDVFNRTIDNSITDFINYLKDNSKEKELIALLHTDINVPTIEVNDLYPRFKHTNQIVDQNSSSEKLTKIKLIISHLESLIELEKNQDLIQKLKHQLESLKSVKEIYINEYKDFLIRQRICNALNTSISNVEKITNKLKTDAASTMDTFDITSSEYIENFCNLLVFRKNKKVLPRISNTVTQKIIPNERGSYKFYSSILKTTFTQNDFESMLLDISDGNKIKKYEDFEKYDIEIVPLNGFKSKGEDQTKEEYLRKKCQEYLNKNILGRQSYIMKKEEKLNSIGYSAGKNSLIYLDIIKDSNATSLLVFDQPEDDVSQNKIATDLIDIINFARKSKQIIFITHNPQLVVNLDVDNVIILEYNKNEEIDIQYGALEYVDENLNVLDKVATMLDGGKEVLRKRWKRYGKQK